MIGLYVHRQAQAESANEASMSRKAGRSLDIPSRILQELRQGKSGRHVSIVIERFYLAPSDREGESENIADEDWLKEALRLYHDQPIRAAGDDTGTEIFQAPLQLIDHLADGLGYRPAPVPPDSDAQVQLRNAMKARARHHRAPRRS